ncbi:MAG: MHFG family PEP-CTERM protein [Rubrivivax sp.]
MPLLFAAALAASTATVPSCSWDRPGADAFVGNVVNAVDRYKDIPEATRTALKRRMAARQYDEIAAIRRDSITGKHRYAPELRQMHFGGGQICGTVTRSQWKDSAVERGLVYCEDGHCLIVPTVCRNVSRVTRLEPAPEAPPARPNAKKDAEPEVAVAPTSELQFDAPGAGSSFAEQAGVDAGRPGDGLFALGGASGAGGAQSNSNAGFPSGGNGVGGVIAGNGGAPAGPSAPESPAPSPTPSVPTDGPPTTPPIATALRPPLPIDSLPPSLGEGGIGLLPVPVVAVPESGTLLLTALGLAALAPWVAAQRRRRALRSVASTS